MKNLIMRALRTSILALAAVCAAPGQTYTIQTIAGGGVPENIPGASASLSRVTWVTTDKAGNLFMSLPDHHVVLRLDAATGVLTRVAGNGTAGLDGENVPATSAQLLNPGALAMDPMGNLFITDTDRVRMVHSGYISTAVRGLNGPSGIAVDQPGNLYIAEAGNNNILELSNGKVMTVVGAAAQLNNPQGIAFDTAGRMYIADTGNSRVLKIENGAILTLTGALTRPRGVAANPDGTIYIVCDGAGRVFQYNGLITTTAGTGARGFNGDGGPAPSAWLNSPQAIALDRAGNLFIADTNNFRVRKVAKGVISTVAGGGTEAGDNGLATQAWLYRPTGVSLDSSGDLYIADSNNYRIREVANGNITTVAGSGAPGCGGDGGPATSAQLRLTPLFEPPGEFQGLAMDPAGSLLFADSTCNRVRKIAGETITSVAGGGTQLSGSQGLAMDSAGNIYIADQSHNRVLKLSNGTMTAIMDGGISPSGLALDSSGNLYFADQGNNTVRRISNGVVTTIAGGGTGCDNCPATEASLNGVTGIALDTAGSLYVSESQGHVVRKIEGGVIRTVAGNGKPGSGGDGGPATNAQLWNPEGLAVDAAGNIYIADTGNNRVRVLVPSGTVCAYEVTPAAVTTPATGGRITASVRTGNGCAWAAQNLPGWVSLLGDALGTGAGTITLSAEANPGTARSSTVSIAGVTVSIQQEGTLAINPGGLMNAGSYAAGAPVALGSIATVFGSYLLSSPVNSGELPLPHTLAGLSLYFSTGVEAPLLYASAEQVNFQVPWELAGQHQTTLTAILNGHESESQTVNLTLYAPGIFTTNGQGSGQGAILDSSNRLADASNPAARGSTVQIFCTGLGPVTNQPRTGSPAPFKPLSWTNTKPTVTIGGLPAELQFYGLAPGTVGLYQVNAVVPRDSAIGDSVPVVIEIGGATSNGVTIAIE